MLPMSEIKNRDQFQNPLFRDGIIFVVEDINQREKMVKVQAFSIGTCRPIGSPFWKRNTDRMFSESWRFGVR
jgi:hypothetical protein